MTDELVPGYGGGGGENGNRDEGEAADAEVDGEAVVDDDDADDDEADPCIVFMAYVMLANGNGPKLGVTRLGDWLRFPFGGKGIGSLPGATTFGDLKSPEECTADVLGDDSDNEDDDDDAVAIAERTPPNPNPPPPCWLRYWAMFLRVVSTLLCTDETTSSSADWLDMDATDLVSSVDVDGRRMISWGSLNRPAIVNEMT